MQPMEESLYSRAKSGEEAALAALITRMMPAIRKGAAACVAPGLDYEDAVQEGLIGLFNAVRGYDPGRGIPFAGYAAVCINNAQQGARRRALRKKNAPLNFSVPLPETWVQADPEEQAIAGEEYAAVWQRIRTGLSVLERQALLANLDGQSVAQTAHALGRGEKTVHNALARARRKLRGAV